MNSPKPAPWFERAIGIGLAKLGVLALPGTPIDQKTAAALRAVWVDTLWPHRPWDEAQDGWCIEAAFAALARASERFPAPAHFLRYLPERRPVIHLPSPPMSEAARQRGLAMAKALIEQLRQL